MVQEGCALRSDEVGEDMKRPASALSDSDMRHIEREFAAILPRVLPAEWSLKNGYTNAAWFVSRGGMAVCLELESHDDGLWLHLSVSRRDRDPSYADLKVVKGLFIGRERKAIQVFPADSEHYNFHPHCLHLWSPVTSDPLPDLRTPEGQL